MRMGKKGNQVVADDLFRSVRGYYAAVRSRWLCLGLSR